MKKQDFIVFILPLAVLILLSAHLGYLIADRTPDRVQYLERRVSALELAADSLQRQIDFICE